MRYTKVIAANLNKRDYVHRLNIMKTEVSLVLFQFSSMVVYFEIRDTHLRALYNWKVEHTRSRFVRSSAATIPNFYIKKKISKRSVWVALHMNKMIHLGEVTKCCKKQYKIYITATRARVHLCNSNLRMFRFCMKNPETKNKCYL